MKPYCCRMKMSTLAKVLLILDILRAMLVGPVLIGVFIGMGTVKIYKFNETVIPSKLNTKRVDFYRNREILVRCICAGITICSVDVLLALALDKILHKNLGKASMIYLMFATAALFIRNAFYGYIYQHEVELGLHRLDDLTHTVNMIMRILFYTAVAYEAIKVLEIIVALAAQREFEEKKRIIAPQRKQEILLVGGGNNAKIGKERGTGKRQRLIKLLF